jgi:hypothetical protein
VPRVIAFAALVLLPVLAGGQDADPIGEALRTDKEAYVAAVEKARQGVLASFDKYYETVKTDKGLKIEAQLAKLEKIEAEKKAFDEAGTVPSLPGLKVAMSEYRTAQKKAEAACKLAFEKAAKAYRDAGDVKAAVATLDEMKDFLARPPAGAPAGAASPAGVLILSRHSGKVIAGAGGAGSKLLTADFVKGDATQLWRTVPVGDVWFYLEQPKTGLVVSVTGRTNGSEAVLAAKSAAVPDRVLFKAAPVPGAKDTLKLVNKGGDGRVLGIDARRKDSGARILLWEDNGGCSEWWSLVSPP